MERIKTIEKSNKLTDREKVNGILQHINDVSIIFDLVNPENKVIMCNKCREYITPFKQVENECIFFECKYCKKVVKMPLYCWQEDVYNFPNEHYTDAPRYTVSAQSLAQAHRKLVDELYFGGKL